MKLKKSPLALGIGAALVATAAYALTQLAIETPITLSVEDVASGALGTGGNKTKLFRHRDGTLVAVYGDFVDAGKLVYDLKAQAERPARDIFARTCDSIATSCLEDVHWTLPVNLSLAAGLSSISSDWRGITDNGYNQTYWGDAEKPNGFINPAGITVVSWVSHYCPGLVDGAPTAIIVPEIDRDPTVQRAREYLERDFRIIPYTCTWVAHSMDRGATWLPPVQLSSGERAAKQDVNRATQNGWAVTWQEDPSGLELGQGLGPGDGASGANISGGTDIWYSRVTTRPPAPTPWSWAAPVRLTDNFEGKTGTSGSRPFVYDAAGQPVDDDDIEKGNAGASRANLGAVGNTLIVAWEEKKGSEGLDEGKFVRYLSFPYNTPPQQPLDIGTVENPEIVQIGTPGCILSDPTKNSRRVRFVTQSADAAGENGMQIAIFWKEGATTQGGPSDIRMRRWINDGTVNPATEGFSIGNFYPPVDPACSTSVYSETQDLGYRGTQYEAENVTSRTKQVAASGINNLGDDTELQFTENALAHRGLLRGRDLWLGYAYTENLALLTYLNMDNYNFWIRQYNVDTGDWQRPKQVSNITDTTINLREPRLVGTMPSSDTLCPSLAEECQNPDVFFVAWGSQTNVSPWAPEPKEELGLWMTRTTDAGQTFEPAVQLSVAQGVFGGSLPDDEEGESAFESQLQARPDGNKIHAVWNQSEVGGTVAKFTVGEPVEIPDPDPAPTPAPTGGGGGCTLSDAKAGFDPLLPGTTLLALGYLALRRKVAAR